MKIVDPDSGAVVERGEPGELCTRGYSVMPGYWNDPERTAEAIDADGWMHTGDLATMDADGYVNIVGRIKDMIIRGGENIYPREIEEFLYAPPRRRRRPGRSACPTRATARSSWRGSRCARARRATEEDVRDVLPRAGSPTSRCRATCSFTDEFPMTVTGKVQKYKMREAAIAELGLEDQVRATA